uniref:cytochrome-c oxidase n=1 Tax=Rhynchopus euleeides TaxID=630703 RepID=A0A2D2AJV5_9EUGL|nr:cytochrome c oxidase subunit 2 [Rhynchopus euleeides]
MLLHSMSMLYTTHLLMESINLSIIAYVVSVAVHSICISSRSLYSLSLYVEMVWLLTPSAAITLLVSRVVIMQCSEEEIHAVACEILLTANQWFWTYTTSHHTLYSYAIREQDMCVGDVRLLASTQYIVVEGSATVLCTICSSDVLHAWALPSLGMKVDAVPGRATTCSLAAVKEGVSYGQCSEICGSLHGYMPLAVVWV